MYPGKFLVAFSLQRKGYAILLAMFAAVSLAFFVFSISSLNSSYRSQVVHTNQAQIAFQIGFSGFQRVVAKIWLKPWEERFFLSAPVTENGLTFLGGTYDSYVENAPGNPLQADVYIRVRFEGVSRVFVWRVEHVPDLLDMAQLRTIVFGGLEESQFPTGPGSSYGLKINQILTDRATNLPKAEQLAQTLSTLSDVRDIAAVLGARAPALPAVVSLGLPPYPTGTPNLANSLPSFNPGGLANPPDFPRSSGNQPPDDLLQDDSLFAGDPLPPSPPMPTPGDPMTPDQGDTASRTYKCGKCNPNTFWPSRAEKSAHMKAVHNTEGPRGGAWTGGGTPGAGTGQGGIPDTGAGVERIKCSNCNQQFSTAETYAWHKQSTGH